MYIHIWFYLSFCLLQSIANSSLNTFPENANRTERIPRIRKKSAFYRMPTTTLMHISKIIRSVKKNSLKALKNSLGNQICAFITLDRILSKLNRKQ